MWERLSEFLFENSAVAGVQFENWMWLIGVPVLIICLYFSERGFHWKTRDTPRDPPGG
jgi:hypothetical protein